MKLKLGLLLLTLVVAMSAIVGGAATTASAKSGGSALVPIDQGGLLGDFTITKFKRHHGVITALGTFAGTVNGTAVTTSASAPVEAINGVPFVGPSASDVITQQACGILDLTLGPLHLDLLGLVVDLNAVHLVITAEPGPGNLLGNLLCAVAGLLDGGGPGGLNGLLQSIVNLLNEILGQL